MERAYPPLKKNHATLLFPAYFLLLLLSGSLSADWHYEEHQIFGTNVSIHFWADDNAHAKRSMNAVTNEMWRIHNQLSPYIAESELSQLNQHAYSRPVVVSEELEQIINKSLYYSRLSDGAFDISFASVGRLYDYREGEKPNDQIIATLRASIDYNLIQVDPTTNKVRFSDEYLSIDLGGIAKGYAVDRAIETLRALGIKHAAITAGGDSRMLGDKLGSPWIVGIKNPRSEDSVTRIPLDNFAISTSGDYERFFVDADTGERIHHILNPVTGTSAKGLMSVSVIGPQGFDTDPLSTTLFVLGREKGLALIEQIDGYDAIFIDDQGKMHFSSGLMLPK